MLRNRDLNKSHTISTLYKVESKKLQNNYKTISKMKLSSKTRIENEDIINSNNPINQQTLANNLNLTIRSINR